MAAETLLKKRRPARRRAGFQNCSQFEKRSRTRNSNPLDMLLARFIARRTISPASFDCGYSWGYCANYTRKRDDISIS